MERQFDSELQRLKELILSMGANVEAALDSATHALISRDPAGFNVVMELEKKINSEHMMVDDECIKLLARQAPLASDLRMIVAILKINTDLERMGDQAVNISHNGRHYLSEPPLKPLIDLPKMAIEVKAMVREALDALVRHDETLARDVVRRDDIVDSYKNQIFRELITYMLSDPRTIERALNLILIARNLERLGDHATNIAEDVIFAVTGQDIRHGGRKT
jgi:phosphate transport system protein